MVPHEPAPRYQTLSPHPPHFQLETALPVPLFTQVPSNLLSVQEILQRIWSGTDLDQIAFREGGITFQNLRDINRVDKSSSTRFHEDRENEGEELQAEDSLHLIQDPHPLSNSKSTPDFGPSSNKLWPIPFWNDNQWELFLNSEIERIFGD